uniref:Uncharacterized protein n=1 Tax=Romanomermis culicivorax TaxID=13658 RepID=A0A915IRP2_ROMCU
MLLVNFSLIHKTKIGGSAFLTFSHSKSTTKVAAAGLSDEVPSPVKLALKFCVMAHNECHRAFSSGPVDLMLRIQKPFYNEQIT